MKIISYNVNGIRSALNKGLAQWLQHEDADVVCFQEIKAEPAQFDVTIFEILGYTHHYWFPAQKKGYSGVAIISKIQPLHVEYGCGHPLFDAEGRVLRLDFANESVMSVYMPSGTSGEERQNIKYQFLDYFEKYVVELKQAKHSLAICGDYNICHREIDIHDPKSNKNSSGFLPEERAWMEKFFNLGYFDSFRQLNPQPHEYSWWSLRANSRARNKGWRIDYISLTEALNQRLSEARMHQDARHSDHCPVSVVLK